MLKNYFKIALRNIKKYKGFSFINIFGLAISISCCLLIYFYVQNELSYDKYHDDADLIYRINLDLTFGKTKVMANNGGGALLPALLESFPQIETGTRVLTRGSVNFRKGDKNFYEKNALYADPEILDVFTFSFIKGNREYALDRPGTAIITERMASKYFGYEDPIGEVLYIDAGFENKSFEVTGVLENCPTNSHLKYDFILSLETLKNEWFYTSWGATMFRTYVKVMPGTDINMLDTEVRKIGKRYNVDGGDSRWVFFIQPLTDIHLYSESGYGVEPRFELEPPGNIFSVYIFITIGFLILIVASLNFINLSTARSLKRAREIVMRKVVGAERSQIIKQFLGETFLVVLCAIFFSYTLIFILLPYFNNLTELGIDYGQLFQPNTLIALLVLSILIGFGAGLYPAFVLSKYRPIVILKGFLTEGIKGALSRKLFVIIQFSISIILVIVAFVIYHQLHFMKNQYLGFDKEQKLVIPVRGISISENYEDVKNEFSKYPFVAGVSVSSGVPGRGIGTMLASLVGVEDNREQVMRFLYLDYDFIDLYKIELVAGRSFNEELKTDQGKYMINEAAVKAFNINSPEEAVGKQMTKGRGRPGKEIVGVVKNFHFMGLQTEVYPLVMEVEPPSFSVITLSLSIANLENSISRIKEKWSEFNPGRPFEYFFLDSNFNQIYRSEERIGKIFNIFTMIGLFITCLGLLGLVSFLTEKRFKEIGIRKVLGASVSSIVVLLGTEFVKWVLIATLISWPIAYYAMNKWLQNFAYRINIGLGIFIVSGVVALMIALLTVSYQIIKAATANPVDSLRYE